MLVDGWPVRVELGCEVACVTFVAAGRVTVGTSVTGTKSRVSRAGAEFASPVSGGGRAVSSIEAGRFCGLVRGSALAHVPVVLRQNALLGIVMGGDAARA